MRRHLFEDLLHVDLDGVGHKTTIAEYHTQRLEPGQLLDQFLVHAGIETGDEGVVVHKENFEFFFGTAKSANVANSTSSWARMFMLNAT